MTYDPLDSGADSLFNPQLQNIYNFTHQKLLYQSLKLGIYVILGCDQPQQ